LEFRASIHDRSEGNSIEPQDGLGVHLDDGSHVHGRGNLRIADQAGVLLDAHVLHVLLLLAGMEMVLLLLLLLLLDRSQRRNDVQLLLVQHLFALLHLFAFLGPSVLEPDLDLLDAVQIFLVSYTMETFSESSEKKFTCRSERPRTLASSDLRRMVM